MKTFTLITFALLLAGAVFGAPKITAVQNNGQWNAASSWDLNRLPQNGDTIVIPAGLTIFVSNMNSLNNVYIRIYGILSMTGGKLDLDIACTIVVFNGGLVLGITNGDQIRIGSVHKFKGGGAPIVGPAYANANTGTYPSGFVAFGGTLAVKFLNFYAKKLNASVQLSWSTEEEKNNNHFEVERSDDGRNWKNISVVFANTNSSTVHQYQYTDKLTVINTIYYRLKQVDKDGKFMYSTVKTVHAENQNKVANIYASSKKTIVIEFNDQINNNIHVRVIASNGQSLQEISFTKPAYRHEIHLSHLSAGIYIIQVIDGSSIAEVKKVVL